MERLRPTDRTGARLVDDQQPLAEPERQQELRPLELPAGWKKLAGLEVGAPATRAQILTQLPVLLGQSTLDREVAHQAVHAVVMGLAAGRWGKQGAPIISTDRVLSALDQVDAALAKLDRVDPNFRESYDRYRLLARRALDHCGPNGLWGPPSIYGPLDNHPSNPSSLFPNFQTFNLLGAWVGKISPMDDKSSDILKRTGEHDFELLPGGTLATLGPPSELFWALGASGNNGGLDFQRYVEGGAWRDSFGKVVSKIGKGGDEQPLYEIYGEAYASTHTSKDAFFGVEGTAKHGDEDAYRFDSKHEQWLTISASQVTPGRRFAITLYELGKKGARTEIDRSEGIAGPAGIHTKIPAGRYEVKIEQIAPDPTMPELTQNPVGKRLGPALMNYREAWGEAFPKAVDQEAENDPNRYRLYVSGSGPTNDASFGLPTRDQIQEALRRSAQQEKTLEQSVVALEQTVRTLEGFQAGFDLATPIPISMFMRMWGVYPFIRPADDRSDPNASSDPMIERFMRASARLDQMFYGGKLADWIRTVMPSAMVPLQAIDAQLRALGHPGLPLPRTVANHEDR